MTTSRIPPPLSSYLHLPPETSLVLVTSTVNTTANWILFRYIHAALNSQENGRNASDIPRSLGEKNDVGVVLVSYLRDFSFWKTEAKRAVGLDLARLQQQERFAFVDGLSRLFTGGEVESGKSAAAATSGIITTPAPAIPGRTPLSMRGLPQPSPHPALQAAAQSTPQQPPPPTSSQHTLTSPTLSHALTTIATALSSLTTATNLLILDTPSLHLSTTSPPISSRDLTALLLTLSAHPKVHSLVLSLPADEPFLAPAASAALSHLHDHTPGKSLSDGGGGYESSETESASFLVSAAHMARVVIGCRPLGTGWAEDVSGIVRITRGGAADEVYGDGGGEQGHEDVKEGEWLYFVSGDGGVDVWGKGESVR